MQVDSHEDASVGTASTKRKRSSSKSDQTTVRFTILPGDIAGRYLSLISFFCLRKQKNMAFGEVMSLMDRYRDNPDKRSNVICPDLLYITYSAPYIHSPGKGPK